MSGADRERPDEPLGLRVGTVGRAHGLDGNFHVAGGVEAVLVLLEVGSELRIGGRPFTLTRVAGHTGRPLLAVQDVESREAAEGLRGQEIHLPRSAAPELDEDEWWAEDLEGCAVVDGERAVGTVTALLELPSCDVLEVRREGDDEAAAGARPRPALLVPLVRDAVRTVDIDAGVIDVDLAFLGER